MFVYFCQHLTVIIFNHSHTCLSLKIELSLLRRQLQAVTAFPELFCATFLLLVSLVVRSYLFLPESGLKARLCV
jgi:hypothetical protein